MTHLVPENLTFYANMNRFKKFAAIFFGAPIVLVGVIAWSRPKLSFLDGSSGLVAGILFGEDTEYTPGYSEQAWTKVQVGMSLQQVRTLIGPPQKHWPISDTKDPGTFGERWSYSPGDTNFRCRVLIFREGHVYDKHQEFYVD